MKRSVVIALLIFISACQLNEESMTNLEMIKSTYQGESAQENADNLLAHLNEDIIWIEAKGFPLTGTYTSKQAINDHVFTPLNSEWHHYKINVEQYIVDGAHIITLGTYSGVYKKTGLSFSARVAHHWQLKQGKITHFEQFVDSVPVAQAMGSKIESN